MNNKRGLCPRMKIEKKKLIPLRIVSCTVQPWPKSIKIVREGNEQ